MARKKYSNPRPRIPTGVQRDVRIESGFACLVCKERVSLNLHHIDGDRENNVPDNIANICANCHGMVHDGKISPEDLRECKRRAQAVDEELARLRQTVDRLVGAPQIEVSGDYGQLKLKYHGLLNDYADKLIFYQAFIYLIPEFYLDTRGEEARAIVRNILALSPEEERIIIDHLIRMGIVEVVGDLIALKNTDDAKTALNELIKSGAIDIDRITSAFVGI